MLERLGALPQDLPKPAPQLTADAGHLSEANVDACDQAGIEPSLRP
jgi:hypothetical protein